MRTHMGSFGKDPKEGRSRCFRKAGSHFLQGGCAQITPPCKAATLKSKYDIIISILRDQIDRSEV